MATITRETYRDGELIATDTLELPTSDVEVENELRDRARQAIEANRAYLANQSPTAADVRTQVDRLTRQNQALIPLVVGLLDGTD